MRIYQFSLALKDRKPHKPPILPPSMTTSSICTRSIAAVVALSFAALASHQALAQTTATTVPVGFITKTIPAAVDPNNPSNAALSIPLYATAVFTSSVASVDSANSFTMTSAAWTVNQFTAVPHLVRIKSGANVGKFFLISGNSANQLTVVLPPSVPTLVGFLSVSDSCEVLPANTLSSVFGATAPSLVTGATSSVADNVLLWSGVTWDLYFNNGTNWRKVGSFANQNNVVIFPDDGLFVSHRGAVDANLTFMGTVPSTAESTDLPGAGANFISNRFPTDATLLSMGLQTSPGWVTGATASVSDNVYIWNVALGTWDLFFHNGASWRKVGSFANQNTAPVAAGTSLYVSRVAAAPSVLTQALPYTP